jgi:uncharacterized protein YutD
LGERLNRHIKFAINSYDCPKLYGFFRNHTQESINKIKLTRVRQYIYLYDLFDQSLIYIFSSFREAIKLLGANQPALR